MRLRRFGGSIIQLTVLFAGMGAFATPGITYHGRLLKPNSTPVTSNNVQFKMQIRTPGIEDCLLYEEIQTKDLSTSAGVFAVNVGDGSGTRTDAHASDWSLFDSLSNRQTFNFSTGECSGPTTYTPNVSDNRRFRVFFDDGSGSGWQSMPTQTINYIPMSVETYAVGGFPASSLFRVEDAGTLGSVAALTTTQYNNLVSLADGSSSVYEKSGSLNGSTLPPIGSGEGVRWNGTSWESYSPLASGDETDPTVETFAKTSLPTCNTGEVLKSDGSVLSCVTDTSGTLPDVGTAGTYTKVTTDAKGRVTSGDTLDEADLPSITTAGKVSGNAITSGEIGGSTSINTAGNITTTGSITSTGDLSVTGPGGKVSSTYGSFRRLHLLDDQTSPHHIELRSPDPLANDYTLTLPSTLGSANQVLGMNNSGTALENKSLTEGTGVTITHTTGGIEISATGSGGTVTNVTGTAPISVATGTTTPVISLDDSGVGAATYGSATQVPVITVDAKGRITSASNTTISGVSPVGSTLSTGKAWMGDASGDAQEAYINVSDLKKSDGTNQIPTTCANSQTLTWSSLTDVFTCTDIAIEVVQISDFPTLGTAAVKDFGTSAGDLVELDGGGKIPSSLLPSAAYDTIYFKNGGNAFSAAATLGTTDNNGLNLITNNIARMTVLANGNVGIGTTSPAEKLHVVGILKVGGEIRNDKGLGTYSGYKWYEAGSPKWSLMSSAIDNSLYFQKYDGTAWDWVPLTFDFTNENSHFNGNVGIGTTNPMASLHIIGGSGTTDSMMIEQDQDYASLSVKSYNSISNTAPNIKMYGFGGTRAAPSYLASGKAIGVLAYRSGVADEKNSASVRAITTEVHSASERGTSIGFYTTPNGTISEVRAMTIDQSGNVGIGTTFPSEKLEVNGNVKATQFCLGANCLSAWPAAGGSGTVTNVSTGTGLTGGPITTTGTISIANGGVGTTQLADSSVTDAKISAVAATKLTGTIAAGRMPALTGDVTTSAGSVATTVVKIQGQAVSATAPMTNQILKWNGSAWTPSGESVTSVAGTAPISVSGTEAKTISLASGGVTSSHIEDGTITSADLASSLGNGLWAGDGTNVYRSSGKVGIGTTSPSWSLHINNSTDPGGQLYLSNKIETGGWGIFKRSSTYVHPDNLIFSYWNGSAWKEAVNITSSGYVGIGTTTPESKLHIANGGLRLSAGANDAYSSNIVFDKNRSGAATQSGDELGYLGFQGSDGTSQLRGATILAKQAAAAGTNSLPTDLIFATNGGAANATERMRISSSGNVGIGTTAPSNTLTVVGGSSSPSILASRSGTGNTASFMNSNNSAGIKIDSAVGPYYSLLTLSKGNLNRWVVGSNATTESGSNAGANFEIQRYDDSGDYIDSPMMIRRDAGYVGIGTMNPSAPLEVVNLAIVKGENSSSSARLVIQGGEDQVSYMSLYTKPSAQYWQFLAMGDNNAATASQNDLRIIYSGGGEVMRFKSDGNIGIGTSSPAEKLDVWGNVAVSGATVHTSDRRLKENITPLENSLEKVLTLNGYNYYWKNKSVSDRKQIGVIAQEVKKVFPEAVYQNEQTGYYSVNYEGLIPPLIESTKEIFGRCEMSQEQTRALGREIAALKDEIRELKRALCEVNPRSEICRD